MANLIDIKTRMKVVGDTQKITGAMETISVAKMSKAIARYEKNSAYFNRMQTVISDIVLHTNSSVHPYFRNRKGSRAVYIVVASDKGLAGGFNHNILNFAYDKIKERENVTVLTVGQMTREFFDKRNFNIKGEFCDATFNPTIEDAEEISDAVTVMYDSDQMDEAYIVYTKMAGAGAMSPDIIKLLPLVKEEVCQERLLTLSEEEYLRELFYEPSAEQVLEQLIPQYLTGIIYGCLIQSYAGEHSSRRAAMSNATKNADELLSDLRVKYNRARQEAVTGEITDIITATMGVKNE